MTLFDDLQQSLRVSGSRRIARRYFVTNGFDGAMTVLGLLSGFRIGAEVPPEVIVMAGFGTSVALGVSGLSSAYISETAESRAELEQLSAAMLDPLERSVHARGARLGPALVAIVNGLSPFLFAQAILIPLWLAVAGVRLPASPLDLALGIALLLVFLLGVFIGRISRTSWLLSGLRTLALAVVTVMLIMLLGL